MKHCVAPTRHLDLARQRGVAAVEFALVFAVFVTLLFGMIETGRLLFYWNSAAEATRFGARMAIVCDKNDSDIKTKIQQRLPIVPTNKISIDYQPSGCTVDTCQYVTVSILAGVSITTSIPYVPMTLQLPAFSTTLPRESMLSTVGGATNPVCS
jgi:Flp pilus assembly protein TadG